MTRDTGATVTCFIVEDEPLARSRLRALANETPWLECVGEAATGRAALRAIGELGPDLLFLDIRLPDLSGIDVLKRLSRAPAVVFTTAYDGFAVTAFELGALDYLLKPFGRDRFQAAMARVRPRLEGQMGTAAGERSREVLEAGPVRRLFVRDGDRIVPLAVSSVERFEACDDFVLVHAGSRKYRLNLQLSDLEARLDCRTFIRIHRSHLVNFDHVAALAPYDGSRYHVTLKSGAAIVASRQRSRDLREMGRLRAPSTFGRS